MRRLALAALLALWPALASAQFATIGPTPATSDNGDRLATTAWVNNVFAAGIPGNLVVSGNLTIGGIVIETNGEQTTNIVAPATPAAGLTRVYVDSTTKVLTFKNDAGLVGNAVVPSTCSASQWARQISSGGVITCSQPAVTDISGFAANVATFLATPSSANLLAAMTTKTGTGLNVFGTSPNITTPTGIVKGDVGLGNVINVAEIGRNAIINGDFRINQRAYVSAAALASGIYGHDRWKAGAGGGDYSFTQLKSSTQITIAANKTLIQVVEDANVVGGSYLLSWTGTCTARFGLNTAVPSGSFAASPVVIAGQTAGTVMSVEFGNGAATCTLGTVQLEVGAVATTFEYLPLSVELAKAQRYFEVISAASSGSAAFGTAQAGSTSRAVVTLTWKVQKRIAPTATVSAVTDWGFFNTTIGALVIWNTFTPNLVEWGGMIDVSTATAGLGGAGTATLLAPVNTSARIFINAEL